MLLWYTFSRRIPRLVKAGKLDAVVCATLWQGVRLGCDTNHTLALNLGGLSFFLMSAASLSSCRESFFYSSADRTKKHQKYIQKYKSKNTNIQIKNKAKIHIHISLYLHMQDIQIVDHYKEIQKYYVLLLLFNTLGSCLIL